MEPGSTQRIRIKFGDAEFDAEGPAEVVQSQFDSFIAVVKAMPLSRPDVPAAGAPAVVAAPLAPLPPDPPVARAISAEIQPSDEILSRVFQQRGGMVSLLARPKDGNVADALLMLLYGFERMVNTPAVTGVSLMEACRQSGVQIDRIDRVMSTQGEYVNAGGARRGRRYSLNNPGKRRAGELIVSLV